MTREEGVRLMERYVANVNLRRHMYAVECIMRDGADRYGEDKEVWGLAGLLHDFDWEIHPDLASHPMAGQPILAAAGVPGEIQRAILAHAETSGIAPESTMEKYLVAVDELSGFLVACALVTRSRKLAEVTVEGVIKKLKSRSFASKVDRGHIARAISELGVPEAAHIRNVLESMQRSHEILGL